MAKLAFDAEQVRKDLQAELRSYQRLKDKLRSQKESYDNLKSRYIELLKAEGDNSLASELDHPTSDSDSTEQLIVD